MWNKGMSDNEIEDVSFLSGKFGIYCNCGNDFLAGFVRGISSVDFDVSLLRHAPCVTMCCVH
jgi:hypothetical protein